MKLHLPLFAILATVTLAGCHSASAAQVAAEQMDGEIPAQEFSVTYKDHGAFRGQGTSCTTLQFSDDAFLEKIQEKGVWRPLPLDEDTQNLVYGVYDSDYLGTPLTDEEGMPLIPEIENGYYMINESKEHVDDTSNAFLMHTQDVSVSIYDADNRILYHCALDK